MSFCLKNCEKKDPNALYYVDRDKVKIGDIVLSNKKIVHPEDYENLTESDSIGIVIIPPGGRPDGKITMIGLDFMNSYTIKGSRDLTSSRTNLEWGKKGTTCGLPVKRHCPVVDIVDDEVTNNIVSTSTGGYFPIYDEASYAPNGYTNGGKEGIVPGHYYYNADNISYCPCPTINEDEEPNPAYRATSYEVDGITYNISDSFLNDFDGRGNTKKILSYDTNQRYPYCDQVEGERDKRTDFISAKMCSLYKRGGLEWYLPAAGELGYFISNLGKINASREVIGLPAIYKRGNDVVALWTSTISHKDGAICCHSTGSLGGTDTNRYSSNPYHQVLPATTF